MVRAAQQTLEVLDIFPARHAPDPFCDRNTTLYDFSRSSRLAAPQLSQSFFMKQEWTQDPVPMRESLGSQIPDTAPYIEWLAIVCSIVVAALFCAVLFSNGVLT
jgi:hypothetical protein